MELLFLELELDLQLPLVPWVSAACLQVSTGQQQGGNKKQREGGGFDLLREFRAVLCSGHF